MVLQLDPKHAILTHDNPKHAHMDSLCRFDRCGQCSCTEANETSHCQHCFHCEGCSSAVSRGCRKCTFSPNPAIYRTYYGGPRACNSAEGEPECSICYDPHSTWEKYLNEEAPSPPDLCMVDWEDIQAWNKEQDDDHQGESYTPPRSPPQQLTFRISTHEL
ncbi:hypothetical protein P154DRAFT_193141 [Amniculicola lignicola CBS 123094]|uniref:Uncharacterized protein n=1 Tax=Amniculicola lignicola CBS 123094 TaxID=1392246 RepID=A0A6A5WI47_9PLEO|nr:hypothetical protein P154DRAFT_193141 [Amniculicola lignicola CBS 123094]